MTEELTRSLKRTLTVLRDGLSDSDFSEMMKAINETRSDRGHEDYDGLVGSLIDDLSDRVGWADDGPDDQGVLDWLTETCTMNDDEWHQISAAADSSP